MPEAVWVKKINEMLGAYQRNKIKTRINKCGEAEGQIARSRRG